MYIRFPRRLGAGIVHPGNLDAGFALGATRDLISLAPECVVSRKPKIYM